MAHTTATLDSSIKSIKRTDHPQQPRGHSDDPWDSVASQIGPMRAYARALAVDHDAADMFVKTALLASCDEIGSVERGADIRLWLFGNLHSAFYVAPRHVGGVAPRDSNGRLGMTNRRVAGLVTPQEFSAAFDSLPVAQREALFLTAAARISFSDAAAVCKCSVITLKRRAIAGRTRLAITLF